jgi:hypothetical protein
MNPIVNYVKEFHLGTGTESLLSRKNSSDMKIINIEWLPAANRLPYIVPQLVQILLIITNKLCFVCRSYKK